MPAPLKINKGDQYGRLTIIKEVNKRNNKRCFLCKCDCGNEREIRLTNIRSGTTLSCGCLQKDKATEGNVTHGMSGTRLHGIWGKMIGRCTNKTDNRYGLYGGRGISVCEKWKNFNFFYDWAIRSGYEDNLTLERRDVNGNYNPSNCKWGTWKEQQNNRRNNRCITFKGETMTVKQWSECIGMQEGTLRWRLDAGWSEEDALHTPVRSTMQ